MGGWRLECRRETLSTSLGTRCCQSHQSFRRTASGAGHRSSRSSGGMGTRQPLGGRGDRPWDCLAARAASLVVHHFRRTGPDRSGSRRCAAPVSVRGGRHLPPVRNPLRHDSRNASAAGESTAFLAGNSRRVPPENSRKLASASLAIARRRTLRLPSTTSDYLLVSLKVGTTGGGPAALWGQPRCLSSWRC